MRQLGAQPAPGRRTVSIQTGWLEDSHAPSRLQLAVILLLRHTSCLVRDSGGNNL